MVRIHFPPAVSPLRTVRGAGHRGWSRHSCTLPSTGKQPYAIALADRGLMALAGLWENWRSPAGEWVRSFAIITTTPNELCADLHDRMPVILARDNWPVWLGKYRLTWRSSKRCWLPIRPKSWLAGR